jgi:hypothetical protein
MSNYTISSYDTWEISFYFLYGYHADNITVIPKNGSQLCQFSITGDESLKQLQEQYYDNPVIPMNDFRKMLHRVNSLTGMARKKAKDEAVSQSDREVSQ